MPLARVLAVFATPLLLSACFATAAPVPSSDHPFVIRTDVEASNGRTCTAYLVTASETTRGAPVVLSMWGTGEYSMARSWDRDPSAETALGAGAAWLVFDKPGIAADPASPGGFTIDDAIYNEHTLADLEACAAGVLVWASSVPQVGGEAPIVVRGHSEGALVAGRLLLRLHETADALAPRIAALLLSGTPAAGMGEIFARQAKARGLEEAYAEALAAGDDAFVRGHAGVGAATLRALLRAPSLRDTFATLAKHRPSTRIAIFQGITDTKTFVDMVRDLVADNEARLDHGEPGLELAARYYDAGHGLNLAAVHDINLWLVDALRTPGYLAGAEREAAATAVRVEEETLAAVVGSYRIDEGMTLEIRRQGTRLFARATGQEAFPVYFTAENRLETRTAPIVLEVEREETRVPAVVLIQGGRHRCPRIE